jgi:hypothetical protein
MSNRIRTLSILAAVAAVAGCAVAERETEGPPRKESLVGVTESNQLVRFNGGQPQKVTVVGAVKGMQPGESVVGIDFRVSRGVLFALGSTGRIYTIDAKTAQATAIGGAPLAIALEGKAFGFDFNPTVDRIRIVSETGQNFRGHPDTGAAVDSDPNAPGVQGDGRLAYAASDANAGKAPRVVGAGYTYNKQNEKITTNYAIDAATGSLVMQGTKEGATPAVSPNTGQLFTVGSLGIGSFSRASFDISDVNNAAYLGADVEGRRGTRLYSVDLATGKASFIGTVGGGESLRGLAIEP